MMKYSTYLFCLCMLLMGANNCTAQKKIPIHDKRVGITNHAISLNMNDSILLYINQYRQNKGLASLQLDSIISVVALEHSINMATKKTAFGHDGFEERMQKIVKNFPKMKASAENVAFGKLSAEGVVKGWINSPHHRKNIEGDYAYMGIGVAKDSKGVSFFTQIFIRK